MWSNKTLIAAGMAVLVLVAGSIFAASEFSRRGQMADQLNTLLADAYRQKEELEASVEGLQAKLAEKEQLLASLSDVAGLRQAMINAQANAESLSKELARLNKDRSSLQLENVGLSTRLENTTREYLKNMAELKTAQDEVARYARGASPDKKKLEQLARTVEDKTKELAAQREQFEAARQESQRLAAANKELEQRVRDLQERRASLAEDVEELDSQIASRRQPSQKIEASVAALRKDLSERESRIRELERQLADAGRMTVPQKEAAGPSRGTPEAADLKKMDSMRQEMSRLSDILMRKEFEIETARKETLEYKEKMVAMQEKAALLESSAGAARASKEQMTELANQKMIAENRLSEAKAELAKKNELLDSLQKNVDYINAELAKKERERAKLQDQLSGLQASSRDDLEREKNRSTEANLLYSSLKAQLAQYTETIQLKEEQLEADRTLIVRLQDEIDQLRFKSERLERDLADARDRQRKVMDDLSAAVRLNAVLQERLFGQGTTSFQGSGSSSPDDRQKAEELKRRIEVILEPEKR